MNKKDFLDTIDNFISVSEISATNLGVLALEDPSFVLKIRRGRECREATQEKVLLFMDRYAAEKGIEWAGGTNV